MQSFLTGIIPPIVTPFEADGRLDLPGYEANVESYAGCDFSGLLVLGSNGEAACLSLNEKVAIIRAAVARSNRRPIYAGTGTDSTRTTIELTTCSRGGGGFDMSASGGRSARPSSGSGSTSRTTRPPGGRSTSCWTA